MTVKNLLSVVVGILAGATLNMSSDVVVLGVVGGLFFVWLRSKQNEQS